MDVILLLGVLVSVGHAENAIAVWTEDFFVIHIWSSARYSALTDKFAYFKYYLGSSIVYERTVLRIHDILVWIRIWDPRIHASKDWLIDPDPDPAIFVIDLLQQDANKKFNLKFFCWLLFEGIFTSFFKDKKSKRNHKAVGIKIYLTIFAWRSGSIPQTNWSGSGSQNVHCSYTQAFSLSWDSPYKP